MTYFSHVSTKTQMLKNAMSIGCIYAFAYAELKKTKVPKVAIICQKASLVNSHKHNINLHTCGWQWVLVISQQSSGKCTDVEQGIKWWLLIVIDSLTCTVIPQVLEYVLRRDIWPVRVAWRVIMVLHLEKSLMICPSKELMIILHVDELKCIWCMVAVLEHWCTMI